MNIAFRGRLIAQFPEKKYAGHRSRPAFVATDVIAARSTRQQVADWAGRVVRRHVRRTPALHRRLTTEKAVLAAATLDRLSPEVVDRIVKAFRSGDEIHSPDKQRLQEFIERALDTMDFMESLPLSDRRIRRIERLSWTDAEQMSADWHASLARVRAKSRNVMAGVRKIAEFSDGSFIAELTTAQALKTEGAEMGHCVGGYWNRVRSGDTRIVSLRDADGRPHVTIELTRPSEVDVAGRGKLRLMANLRAGVNEVVASGDWYAAQIRGKQNLVPVPKYADKVRQWMRDASIPSREDGFQVRPGDEELVVYAVPRGQGFFLSENADEALAVAADLALAQLSSMMVTPRGLLRTTRLHEIVRAVRNEGAVAAFARAVMDNFTDGLAKACAAGDGNLFSRIAESGIEDFARQCFAGMNLGFDPLAGLREFLLSLDEKADVSMHEHTVASLPGGSALRARIHTVPAVGLAMLNSGRATGAEERVLNSMEPKLAKVAAAIKADHEVYHVVRASVSGVRKDDLFKAFFACGLGQDYAAAAAQVPSIVRMTVKKMLLEAKRARLAGVNVNIVANLLGEGFETRLAGLLCDQFGSECLVIGPEPQKPVALPRAVSSRVVKSYPLPRR
ncbi:hypothetical protein GOB57_25055 [Sinorhizobium meliloti]|nr:hypothetical protein [Sinorhizobium meliloti]